jgi:hypothetical protein
MLQRRAVEAVVVALFIGAALAVPSGRACAAERSDTVARRALVEAGKYYGGGHLQRALYRLNKALRDCGKARCSADVRAALLRDVGSVQFRRGDLAGATKSWARALKLEPDLALNPDYDAPDLREAWDAVRPTSAAPAGNSEANISPPPPAPPAVAPPGEPERTPVGRDTGNATAPPPAPAGPEAPPEEAGREESPFARLWIGVSGAIDFAAVPGGDDVCRLTPSLAPPSSDPFYCTDPGGGDFPSAAQNGHLPAGQGGHVDAGVRGGDVRVLVAIDYAFSRNLLVGARLGYVLNAYTGDAAVRAGHALGPKVHGEVRATYVFGRDPLAREGFAPTAFVSAGLSEFDVQTSTHVVFDNVAGEVPVHAWLTSAPFFAAVGGGLRYQFSPRIELTIGARLNAAISGNGVLPSFGPEVTWQTGF